MSNETRVETRRAMELAGITKFSKGFEERQNLMEQKEKEKGGDLLQEGKEDPKETPTTLNEDIVNMVSSVLKEEIEDLFSKNDEEEGAVPEMGGEEEMPPAPEMGGEEEMPPAPEMGGEEMGGELSPESSVSVDTVKGLVDVVMQAIEDATGIDIDVDKEEGGEEMPPAPEMGGEEEMPPAPDMGGEEEMPPAPEMGGEEEDAEKEKLIQEVVKLAVQKLKARK